LPRVPSKDRSLPDFTRFVVYTEGLLDMILPFLKPTIARENLAQVYGDYLSSHFLIEAGRTIPINQLARLIRPWMGHEGLTKQNVANILRSKYVERVLERQAREVLSKQEETQIVDEALLQALKEEMEREKRAELEDIYRRLAREKTVELQERVKAIEERYTERLLVTSRVVSHLLQRGISSVEEISIHQSLLPEEVCEGVAILARYGFVDVHGVAEPTVENLRSALFKKLVKVRLSREGHLVAPKYASVEHPE